MGSSGSVAGSVMALLSIRPTSSQSIKMSSSSMSMLQHIPLVSFVAGPSASYIEVESMSESYSISSMVQMLSSDVSVTDSPMASSSIGPSSSEPIAMLSSSIAIVLQQKDESVDLCNNYETIVGDSRISKAISDFDLSNSQCELKYREAVRFISNKGENLQLTEGCSSKDQFSRRCSTFASNVWLPSGGNPTHFGANVAEICINSAFTINNYFFDQEYCSCKRKEFILVQRCRGNNAEEDFYVYRLHPLLNRPGSTAADSKDCRIRYCMELKPGK